MMWSSVDFPRAGRPLDRDELAACDLEADVSGGRRQRLKALAVGLGDVAEVDHGSGLWFFGLRSLRSGRPSRYARSLLR